MQVLVVDLDQNNIALFNDYVKEEDIEITVATSIQSAFDLLEAKKSKFEVVVFHHLAESLNSIEFITKLKQKKLPVIVIGKENDDITSIIRLGAYYFAVMPCSKNLFIALLDAASEDKKRYDNVGYKGKNICEISPKIKSLELTLKTMEEVNKAATFLSNFYPDPTRVVIGISELLINAVEHGNLGIDYNEKAKLLKSNCLDQEIESRRLLPENIQKKVSLKLERTKEYIYLSIKDEGEGFDWHKYINLDVLSGKRFHGRGIVLASAVGFDKLEYNQKGNEVKAYVYLSPL